MLGPLHYGLCCLSFSGVGGGRSQVLGRLHYGLGFFFSFSGGEGGRSQVLGRLHYGLCCLSFSVVGRG